MRVVIVRVGGTVAPVYDRDGTVILLTGELNRSEWWKGHASTFSASVVRPQTMKRLRELLPECESMGTRSCLPHIGAATPEGQLTYAGAYVLSPKMGPRFRVDGSIDVGGCLLDQLASVEKRLNALNVPVEWGLDGLTMSSRLIPEETVWDAAMLPLIRAEAFTMVDIAWDKGKLEFTYTPNQNVNVDLQDLLRAVGLVKPRMQVLSSYPIDGTAMMMWGLRPPCYKTGEIYKI
ncbi:MAG: hypothetical protein MR654_05370 [Corynebacterium glucuronolyticum]|nr:hypothetical protein [Corynebacterium glucuronolyticum]